MSQNHKKVDQDQERELVFSARRRSVQSLLNFLGTVDFIAQTYLMSVSQDISFLVLQNNILHAQMSKED